MKQEVSEKVISNLKESNNKFENQLDEKQDEIKAIILKISKKSCSIKELLSKDIHEEFIGEFKKKLDFHREMDLEEEMVIKNNELDMMKENLEEYQLKSSSSSVIWPNDNILSLRFLQTS